jgi:hypothetical protein
MLSHRTSGPTVCKHINIRTNGPTKEEAKKRIKEGGKRGNRKKRNIKNLCEDPVYTLDTNFSVNTFYAVLFFIHCFVSLYNVNS